MLPDAKFPLLGYGPGYLSENHPSSLSWFVSVLVENGIVGMAALLMIVVYAFFKIMNIQSNIKYGIFTSFVAVSLHLMTNTGFYYPWFWLLLVLVQFDWTSLQKMLTKTVPLADRCTEKHINS